MKIAQELAGYSLGEGDLLRRAMGKKKPEVMEAQRKRFMEGAARLGHPEDAAKTIFDLMEKFAGYGFNKSHSAAYALISYQTAWLKTHYLVPFMASLMSNELGNTTGVVKFINDAKEMDIAILPPDVNFSRHDFTIEDNRIRFGLSAVKNVGEGAIDVIVKERETGGEFRNIEDFCGRVNLQKVNRKVIESLIKCGAFDSLGHRRSQLMEIIDQAISYGHEKQRERMAGQLSLFDMLSEKSGNTDSLAALRLPEIPEWDAQKMLALEKEALGFFISGHPLDAYRDRIRELATATTVTIRDFPDKSPVNMCGHVMAIKEVNTRKGERMAFATLEDLHGSIELVCFPEAYQKYRELIKSEKALWVEGTLNKEDSGQTDENGEKEIACKIILRSMETLDDACSRKICGLAIELDGSVTGPEKMEAIKDTIKFYSGSYPVGINITIPGRGTVMLELPDQYAAAFTPAFEEAMEAITGYRCVMPVLQSQQSQPESEG
jgi:DNA polymerase-3 subunit alpha